MTREFLERCLSRGLSLERIGALTGKHPSTVGYWVAKYRLDAVGRGVHAPRGGISKDALAELIARGLSVRAIAAQLGLSPTTVGYWLRRHGLMTERASLQALPPRQRPPSVQRRCAIHGVTTFVREGRTAHYRCRRCRAERVVDRRRTIKRVLVEEAGATCRMCGYEGSPAALHFHHPDPSNKEFAIARNGVSRSLARARLEAEKCVLLCANCHAEVESGYTELTVEFGSAD